MPLHIKTMLGLFGKLTLAGVMVIALSACASSRQAEYGEVSDPLEPMNRTIFKVNDTLDDNVAKPVAKGYTYAIPEPARVGVRNALRNLRSPVNIANQALQGDVKGTANDIGRMLINTTIGIGGLFDVAGYWGMEYEQEDFGQTLARWGVASGPYLVLPLLGPSNIRDTAGLTVDTYADPIRAYLYNIDEEEIYYAWTGIDLLSRRAALLGVLEDMEKSSVDYYAVMRSSYNQYRTDQIRDMEPSESSSAEIPVYDDE